MITDNYEFIQQRRTRIEILEEKISNAENMIEELKADFKEEDVFEMKRIQRILSELRDMKKNIIQIEEQDRMNVDSKIIELKDNSLLIINNNKVEIMNENEKLKFIKKENEDSTRILEQDLVKKNLQIELAKKKENELLEQNSILEDQIRVLKSKAYGYDIAKKFEIYQNKIHNERAYNNTIDPNRNKSIENENLAYSIWEKQYSQNIKHPTKLDEIAKTNGLWIENSASNIERFLYEVNSSKQRRENSGNELINTNMRKYSPMIINKKL